MIWESRCEKWGVINHKKKVRKILINYQQFCTIEPRLKKTWLFKRDSDDLLAKRLS